MNVAALYKEKKYVPQKSNDQGQFKKGPPKEPSGTKERKPRRKQRLDIKKIC